MAKPPPGTTPQQQAAALSIPNMKRHILLCAGPECADPALGEASWAYLKKRIAELHLHLHPASVFRTKCHCLRICTAGPILVVQPDGIWYHSATPEVIERILQEHILANRPVTPYIFTQAPLNTPPPNSHK